MCATPPQPHLSPFQPKLREGGGLNIPPPGVLMLPRLFSAEVSIVCLRFLYRCLRALPHSSGDGTEQEFDWRRSWRPEATFKSCLPPEMGGMSLCSLSLPLCEGRHLHSILPSGPYIIKSQQPWYKYPPYASAGALASFSLVFVRASLLSCLFCFVTQSRCRANRRLLFVCLKADMTERRQLRD